MAHVALAGFLKVLVSNNPKGAGEKRSRVYCNRKNFSYSQNIVLQRLQTFVRNCKVSHFRPVPVLYFWLELGS